VKLYGKEKGPPRGEPLHTGKCKGEKNQKFQSLAAARCFRVYAREAPIVGGKKKRAEHRLRRNTAGGYAGQTNREDFDAPQHPGGGKSPNHQADQKGKHSGKKKCSLGGKKRILGEEIKTQQHGWRKKDGGFTDTLVTRKQRSAGPGGKDRSLRGGAGV